MKVLLDIKDQQAPFVMELLGKFSFVKAKPLSPYKARILEGLSEAIAEVNDAKSEKRPRSAKSSDFVGVSENLRFEF